MERLFTVKTFKNGLKILKAAFTGFINDLALKYSASLAYYTIFSLGPLMLLLISLAGIFLGKDAVQGKVFHEINGIVGNEAAQQIQDIIRRLEMSGKSTISVIIGIFTLIVGATTVFAEIQESINIIWQVKAKPKKGWIKLLKNRLLSVSMIVTLGFLLLVSFVINGVLLALSDRLKAFLPDVTVILFNILDIAVSFIVTAILFGVIYKVLPDAKIRWKDVRSGAIFTAVLFMIGRFLIGSYIEKTGGGSAFGAAGSLIVILLWIYYAAAILYFGAEFTRAYADFYGIKIQPAEFAVHVEQKETEREVEAIPPKSETTSTS